MRAAHSSAEADVVTKSELTCTGSLKSGSCSGRTISSMAGTPSSTRSDSASDTLACAFPDASYTTRSHEGSCMRSDLKCDDEPATTSTSILDSTCWNLWALSSESAMNTTFFTAKAPPGCGRAPKG